MRILLLVMIGFLLVIVPSQAQTNLDTLPPCNFTETVGIDGLRFGAVIVNLENGLGCTENLDEVFNTASVPKVFIAGAYYDWLMNGYISPTVHEFTRNYWMGGRNDCLTDDEIGERFTDEELIDTMINCSDNAATWMIMDSIGWTTVDNYAQSLGIEGIGQVIPYAEVDRRKLAFIDERWNDVPRAIASRFYRGRYTQDLSDYFTVIPNTLNRRQYADINQQYYETYTTNTITPRALADYFLLLRDDALAGGIEGLIAESVFDTMLYTQRQYSAQALPGDVLIASKNGFDRGLLAEANVLFSSTSNRVPSGFVLLFAQYETVTRNNSDLPGPFGGSLNATFRNLSPQIRDILYPNYTQPAIQPSLNLSLVLLNDTTQIQRCWGSYFRSDFAQAQVPILESCFRNLPPRITFPTDDDLAMGLVLRGLREADTRMAFLYTAPDGRQFSYQTDRRYVNDSAVYWLHPLDMAGQWTVDIYIDLQHVYTETIVAQR